MNTLLVLAMQTVIPFVHMTTWHQRNPQYNSIAEQATTLPCRTRQNPNAPAPCVFANRDDAGYSSLDPEIIDAQNQELQSMGAVALISWWGPDDLAGDRYLDVYLSRPSSVPIAILYEMMGLLSQGPDATMPFDDTSLGRQNAQAFTTHLNHLRTKYFEHPVHGKRFVRMGARPVVFLWASRIIRGNRFAAATDQVRSFAYLIGGELDWNGPVRPFLKEAIAGLDAISDYGSYIPSFTAASRGRLDGAYVERVLAIVRMWQSWLVINSPTTAVMPSMTYGYRDSQGNPDLNSTRQEACAFAEALYDFVATSRSSVAVLGGVVTASYNEHYEGSSIEPTQEYGSRYLEVTREVFGPSGNGRCR